MAGLFFRIRRLSPWTSNEAAPLLQKARQTGSPGPYASIPYSRHPIPPSCRVRLSPSSPAPHRVAPHPLGQTLIVTAGYGWAQHEGGPVEEIRPGDVVWFAPGEKHWHGAAPTTAMTHIAVQEKKDGKVVDWMEQVTDEQYSRG